MDGDLRRWGLKLAEGEETGILSAIEIFRQFIAEIDTSKLTKGRPHETTMAHPAHCSCGTPGRPLADSSCQAIEKRIIR